MKLKKLLTLALLSSMVGFISTAFADDISCTNGGIPQCTHGSPTPTCPATAKGPGEINAQCPMGFKPGCLINGNLTTIPPRCIPGGK